MKLEILREDNIAVYDITEYAHINFNNAHYSNHETQRNTMNTHFGSKNSQTSWINLEVLMNYVKKNVVCVKKSM